MTDPEPACPWGRENRAGEGRRERSMHECIDSTEDTRPATICSGSQGCGGSGSTISGLVAQLVQLRREDPLDGRPLVGEQVLAPGAGARRARLLVRPVRL